MAEDKFFGLAKGSTLMIFLIGAIIGIVFLRAAGLDAAAWAIALFTTISITFMIAYSLFFSEEWQGFFGKGFFAPIERTVPQANYNFLIGLIFIPLLYGIGVIKEALFPEQSILFELPSILAQPGAVNYYIRGFTMPVIEELVFGLFTMLFGFMLWKFIADSLDWDFDAPVNWLIGLGFGLLLTSITFASMHSFNPDITSIMLIKSLIFRLILSGLVWGLGIMTFGLGFHIGNNIINLGGAYVLGSLLTQQGVPIILLFIFIIIATIWISYRNITGDADEDSEIDFTLGIKSRVEDLMD